MPGPNIHDYRCHHPLQGVSRSLRAFLGHAVLAKRWGEDLRYLWASNRSLDWFPNARIQIPKSRSPHNCFGVTGQKSPIDSVLRTPLKKIAPTHTHRLTSYTIRSSSLPASWQRRAGHFCASNVPHVQPGPNRPTAFYDRGSDFRTPTSYSSATAYSEPWNSVRGYSLAVQEPTTERHP